jgi:hypothetical protein
MFLAHVPRHYVKHPRDYTVADWMMWSTVGLVIAAVTIGKVMS